MMSLSKPGFTLWSIALAAIHFAPGGDADGVVGREAAHGADGVGAVAVVVDGEGGAGAEDVEPALLPRGRRCRASGRRARDGCRDAGVERPIEAAGAVEAEVVPDLGRAHGAHAGRDADAARGAVVAVARRRALAHRLDQRTVKLRLHPGHVGPGGDALDLLRARPAPRSGCRSSSW